MKTKKNLYLPVLLFAFFPLMLFSQTNTNNSDILKSLQNSGYSFNRVNIVLDDYIEDNYYKHLIYNKKNPMVMGYRIRIFSGSGHDASQQANQTRARFLSRYENIRAYITYVAPDYKVYIGDCRTRSEALKLFQEIKKDFPYAFLVSHPINVSEDNKKISSHDR